MGLIGFADALLAQYERVRTYQSRKEFRRNFPEFLLPPVTLAHDAYGAWNPLDYLSQGKAQAAWIAELIQRFRPRAQSICDWGCGPMRVLRHIPGHFPPPVEILGLDYNPQTVKWCSEHFPSIRFLRNELVPPLPLEDGSIDVIYALSVFTHLSEQLHYAYVADLFRCLKSGGILIVSLHGDRSRNFLSVEEVRSYDAGKLVIRGRAVEGKRPFVAYHSPGFVRGRMFAGREILFHDNTDRISGFHQDLWVVR